MAKAGKAGGFKAAPVQAPRVSSKAAGKGAPKSTLKTTSMTKPGSGTRGK